MSRKQFVFFDDVIILLDEYFVVPKKTNTNASLREKPAYKQSHFDMALYSLAITHGKMVITSWRS